MKNIISTISPYFRKLIAPIIVISTTSIMLSACITITADKYPYKAPDDLVKEAMAISAKLEARVKGYLHNKHSAEIPNALLPFGINLQHNKSFRVQKYSDLQPQEQWAVRYAGPIDLQNVQSGVPDPHSTYLLLGTALAPFGSKVIIEGEYPYARFFSIQVSPPFDGKTYCANRVMGPTEVSIADVDIQPLPGHINPFLPGNDRNAKNRKYRVEIQLSDGDPVALNPDFRPPYQMSDNKLYGGFIQNQGPEYKKLSGKGSWNMGALWIRYYAPDPNKGPTAGVALPKVYYQLPDGRKYFINSNYKGMVEVANFKQPAVKTKPIEPTKAVGPEIGWFKSFGILRSSLQGIYQLNNWDSSANMKKVRDYDLWATGRGEFQSSSASYEPSATGNNYSTYLGRGMILGKEKVVILTGKLPTFPDTRDKRLKSMYPAQVRYFSITGYDVSLFRKTTGSAIHSIMDDEITIDDQRNYIIVYSRPEDRPVNATKKNGITWVNWGPTADLSLMIRWLSVYPHWEMSPNPHEIELPYAIADMAGSNYNPKLLGINDQKGHLGTYLPKVHYMSKSEFEKLGNNLDVTKIPNWRLN